ncbi:MAG: hypothetical protein ACLPTL_16670, partial [Steroidobacteraceae bacterium]
MKPLCATFAVIVLSGCSESYDDLASAFPASKTSTGSALAADSIVITSQRHRGATSYHGVVTVRASADAVDVNIAMPFTKPLSIPQREIAACAMTCFGTSDPNVDLIIPRTGTDLMVRGKELLDWCWSNRKPMLSGAAQRAWNYSGAPLPSIGT